MEQLILYSTEFSAATNLLWPFSVRKSAGLKSSIIIFFTHFYAVEFDRKSKTTILPGTSKKASKRK